MVPHRIVDRPAFAVEGRSVWISGIEVCPPSPDDEPLCEFWLPLDR